MIISSEKMELSPKGLRGLLMSKGLTYGQKKSLFKKNSLED
jgi:hypothetical protein